MRAALREPAIFSAGKRDIRHHFTIRFSGSNVAVAETSNQLVEYLNAEREVVGLIPWTNRDSVS